jgi:D-alanine-D-alanine ligase
MIDQAEQYGKVAVLMGGDNSESTVSLMSGEAALAALIRQGIDAHAFDPQHHSLLNLKTSGFDRVFNALHGANYEDGHIQGHLAMIGIPYTGANVLISALCMDKIFCKQIWLQLGLPAIPFAQIDRPDQAKEVIEQFGLPLSVKPSAEGSSVGISKVKSIEDFAPAVALASKSNSLMIAEPWIEGRELAIAVIDDIAGSIVEIQPTREFYDYEAKYFDHSTQYICPAVLPKALQEDLKLLALRASRALRCTGVIRVDMILDQDNHPWLLEVNTLPGLTGTSLAPKSLADHGLDFDDLVLHILSKTLC